MKKQKKVTHTEATKRVRSQILKTMKAVIADETSKSTLSDVALTKAILARGTWTTECVTREVRTEANIPSALERRVQHFAKEFKAGK